MEVIFLNQLMNTYTNWNNKNELQYKDSDNVMFNISDYNGFRLRLTEQPSAKCNVDNIKLKEKLSNIELYKTHDVVEVLRGDYSRLFFDFDYHEGSDKVFDDIRFHFETIVEICKHISGLNDVSKHIVGFIETNNSNKSELQKLINKAGININVFYNSNQTKFVSAHLSLKGYYINRTDLKMLFDTVSSFKKFNTSFPKELDTSVYKNSGSQQTFRFSLSGKKEKNRACAPELTTELCKQVAENLNNYVVNKTKYDTILIKSTSKEYILTKEYLKTFVLEEEENKMTKEQTNSYILRLLSEHKTKIKKYIRANNPQYNWFKNLVREISYYIYTHSDITDKELFDEFIQQKYQYVRQSNQECDVVINKQATLTAIKYAKNQETQISKIIDIEYSIDEFENLSKGVNFYRFIELFYNSFIFFSRDDENKDGREYMIYMNNNHKPILTSIKEFLHMIAYDGFNTYVNFYKDGKFFSKELNFKQCLELFYGFRHVYYDFDVCSNKFNIYNLYRKPTIIEELKLNRIHNENVELLNEWKVIFETLSGNDEVKKNYILDWFAYMLQHPESYNSKILCIVSRTGTGKSIISHALCQFLKGFSISNTEIRYLIQKYNRLRGNKKLFCFNIYENFKILKQIQQKLTKREYVLHYKYEQPFICKDKSSIFVSITNSIVDMSEYDDENTVIIKSDIKKQEDKFYSNMFDNVDDIKPEYVNNLINFLIQRDISEYNPNNKPFDLSDELRISQRFNESGVSKKLPMTQFLTMIFENEAIKTYRNGTTILLNDLKNLIKTRECEDKEIKKFVEKYKINSNLTSSQINDIIDETKFVCKKSKYRDETRNKLIVEKIL